MHHWQRSWRNWIDSKQHCAIVFGVMSKQTHYENPVELFTHRLANKNTVEYKHLLDAVAKYNAANQIPVETEVEEE